MKFSLLGGVLGIAVCAMVSPVAGSIVNVASFGNGTSSLVNAQAALNAATAGDTIVFPLNGTATWSSGLLVGKPVTIDGNGTTLTAGTTLANGFFEVNGITSATLMRITGFTFNLVNLTGRGLVFQNVAINNLRVDHNTFHHGNVQVEVGGCKGVFDHNFFYNGNSGVYPSAGTRAQADASWVSMAAGTADALFFEDNQFIYNLSWLGSNANNACIDTYNGGKIVIRYNTITATNVPGSWKDTLGVLELHGSAAAGAAIGYWQADAGARRGQSVVEMYNNTINATRVDFLAKLRGSANLIHDNTLNTTLYNPRIIAYEEEQYVNQWDPLRTAWPAEDQVHNSFFWNNTLSLNGVPNPDYFEVISTSTLFIVKDRDYFLHAPQATGGREIFTGANGASGSFPTDGIKYPTKGTMVFDASLPNAYFGYVPFTYPHPLTAGTVTVQTPPTNAKVQIQVTP